MGDQGLGIGWGGDLGQQIDEAAAAGLALDGAGDVDHGPGLGLGGDGREVAEFGQQAGAGVVEACCVAGGGGFVAVGLAADFARGGGLDGEGRGAGEGGAVEVLEEAVEDHGASRGGA